MNINEKIKKIVYYRKQQEFEKYFHTIIYNAILEHRTTQDIINYLNTLPYLKTQKIEGWNILEITYTIHNIMVLRCHLSLSSLLPIKFNP